MKKKEIEKIEYKLADTEVDDSVLNLARAELSQADKVQKIPHKFNLKFALSCAASFVLCLAIILPITISSLTGKQEAPQMPDISTDGSDAPNEDFSQDPAAPDDFPQEPSASLPNYRFEDLIPDIGDGDSPAGDANPDSPEDGDPNNSIKLLSDIDYSYSGIKILSKRTYNVYGVVITVYLQFNTGYKVDVLERYEDFTDEYLLNSTKTSYKVNDENYLAEAYYNGHRYCFTGNFAEQSHFEDFCGYLFE